MAFQPLLKAREMKRCCWSIAFALMSLVGTATFAEPLPINQVPMYGEREKTEDMKRADAALISGVEQQGLSRDEGAKQAVRSGWSYWAKQDYVTAIKRFNQAWLLDPENGNAYHGFALITSMRNGSPDEVERFFKLAVSKTKVDATAFVDYGRFLWTQKRLEASLAQLNKSLQLSPTAHNARANISFVHFLKGDFGSACTWARDAAKNGDVLESGYLEDMCSRR